jgi:hypothetical protein
LLAIAQSGVKNDDAGRVHRAEIRMINGHDFVPFKMPLRWLVGIPLSGDALRTRLKTYALRGG